MQVSFNRHGPFYRLQRRLGLVTDTDLAVGRRAVLFVALAWIPAVVLAAFDGLLTGAVEMGLRRLRATPSEVSEIEQLLRVKLLTQEADGAGRARLGDFTGRGDLRGWLRVAAVRLAIGILRGQGRDEARRDELVEGFQARRGGDGREEVSLDAADEQEALDAVDADEDPEPQGVEEVE